MKAEFFGSNSDQYTNQDLIWKIAERYNKQSKQDNGHATVVRRKQVKEYIRVGIL